MVSEVKTIASDLVQCVDDFRRVDAQFARRLAAVRAPNDTDRVAMRFIADAPDGAPVSPRDLAAHLSISTAAITSVVRRLVERGQIVVTAHPTDARSKVLRPSLRDLHSPADELTRRIESISEEFTPEQTEAVARFLRRLTEEIDDLP